MRAFVVDRAGGSPAVHDLPVPEVAPHEILVRIVAASINPIDWKTLTRDRDRKYPFVLGQDFAGLVVETGARVSRFVIDDRVFGESDRGTYAEYTVVPEDSNEEPVAGIPEDVGDADAATLPTSGVTALASIEALAVHEGSFLLVNGAGGGVGGFATQIAHARGATVIGTVHSGKEAYARSLGVDDAVAYDKTDVAEYMKSKYPAGIDALLDLVSDAEQMKRIASSLKKGGHAVSTIGAIDLSWSAERGIEGKNIRVDQTPQWSHAGLRELVKMVEDGTIRVVIGAERALDDAEEALELSRSGSVDGKIVLTIP